MCELDSFPDEVTSVISTAATDFRQLWGHFIFYAIFLEAMVFPTDMI